MLCSPLSTLARYLGSFFCSSGLAFLSLLIRFFSTFVSWRSVGRWRSWWLIRWRRIPFRVSTSTSVTSDLATAERLNAGRVNDIVRYQVSAVFGFGDTRGKPVASPRRNPNSSTIGNKTFVGQGFWNSGLYQNWSACSVG